jgi:hypothetical protein
MFTVLQPCAYVIESVDISLLPLTSIARPTENCQEVLSATERIQKLCEYHNGPRAYLRGVAPKRPTVPLQGTI